MTGDRKPLRSHLVAESEAMKQVVAQVEAVAVSEHPALIEGEPGTGRELIARVIHRLSPRGRRPLIAVTAVNSPSVVSDCPVGTDSESLASAAGATLLVKNVSDLRPASQKKLLQILRGGDNQPRVVATADPGLVAAVEAGVFDSELYRALAEHSVAVPPLRERVLDIPPLAARLIREYARELDRKVSVSTRAYDRLVSYPWPGNVAELKQVARSLVVRSSGRVEPSDVDAILPVLASRVPLEEVPFEELVRNKLDALLRRMGNYPTGSLYDDVMHRVEKPLLEVVLEHTGGNQVRAAELLGLNRNTLRRKLADHGILPKGAPQRSRVATQRPAAAKRTRRR